MKKFIIQKRQYLKDCTVSYVHLPDKADFFCRSLEDVGRPNGVKIPGETCIPEGVYRVIVTHSNRFNKRMLQIFNRDDDKSVELLGVKFTGVRIHGGNTISDTLGCPLYAYNYDDDMRVWGRASDELLVWVDEQEALGYEVYVVICS